MDQPITVPSLREALIIFGICAAAALIGAITLLVLAAQEIAKTEIPEDADFFETLQHVPITVPLALDLLDMAFDIFAAPISWIVLELLGLQALQMVTVFEGLIPGTQLIPTLTAAWIVSRMMKKKKRTPMRSALQDYQLEDRRRRYSSLSSGSIADRYRSRALLPPEDEIIEGEYEEKGEYYEEDLDEPPPEFFEEDFY